MSALKWWDQEIPLQETLAKITYKDSYTFQITPWCGGRQFWLSIYYERADSTTGEPIPLFFRQAIPTWLFSEAGAFDEARFLRWMSGMVHVMEMHEADEWLKIDGVHLREPHPH